MTVSVVLDSAGRRRSPATMPGYHAGRAPRNKGQRYPADPPTVEEIVAVMRQVAEERHGWRLRGLIVVLWVAGCASRRRLRSASVTSTRSADRCSCVTERAAAGVRSPWTPGDGSSSRPGRGTRRAASRAALLHHRRPNSRAALVKRGRPLRAPPARRPGGSLTAIRATPTPPRPRDRTRPRGRPAQHHPTTARSRQPRHDLDLSARHRHRGDHCHRPRQARADDVRNCRTSTLTGRKTSTRRERSKALPPVALAATASRRQASARIGLARTVPARSLVVRCRHARAPR